MVKVEVFRILARSYHLSVSRTPENTKFSEINVKFLNSEIFGAQKINGMFRKKNFDLGIVEPFNYCGFGVLSRNR